MTTMTEQASSIEPMSLADIAQRHGDESVTNREAVFRVRDLAVSYGGNVAIRDVNIDVHEKAVTAFIGPSGCGKSTLIRCFDRMNDLVPNARVEGEVLYHGKDLYADDVDPVEVRRRIGMVFQKPNPFPKSIFDNIAFGPRVLGLKGDLSERVERALHQSALWDEVRDRLKESALGLSGGQQQRLCIARCLAVEPDVILMDEPASALDPISTTRIEDLMHEPQARLHDRDRDAQHAAGRACRRHDRVLLGRGRRGDRQADRRPRRVRRDVEDLHDAGRQAHGGLRDGAVRVSADFQEELDELELSLRGEGELVLRSLRGAVEAVCSQDVELADEVIAFDDDIDSQFFEVEQGIELLLARQTPVASDLRLVLALLKDNLHLERMGDLCVTIAKLTKLTKGLPPDDALLEGFKEMGERAEQMISSRCARSSSATASRRSRCSSWTS